MSTQNTERAETEATSGPTEPDRTPWPGPIRSTVERYGGNGTAATLAGGILLAGAALSARRNARRAGVLGLVGSALLAVGLWRRRSAGRDEAEPSAEAEAHRDRSDVMHQPETNPRGVSGEPDVETRTDPEEGDVRFTAEQEERAGPKPDLEGTTADDPRRSDAADPGTPDDHVEVDLSEASMADEASEATGPTPEQAYPTTEGTDPEPTSGAAPDREAERSEGDGDASADAGYDEDDGEAQADADEAGGVGGEPQEGGGETLEADGESADDEDDT